MTEQQDIAGEFLDSNFHMSMMYGSRIMEQIARAREQKARERESEVREQTRLMEREQTRFERAQEQAFRDHREAGRMKYNRVMNDSFWEKSSPQEIGDTIETALRWRFQDPKAQVACQKIDLEMQARYGVSLADIEQYLNDREQQQDRAEREQQQPTEEPAYKSPYPAKDPNAAEVVGGQIKGIESSGQKYTQEARREAHSPESYYHQQNNRNGGIQEQPWHNNRPLSNRLDRLEQTGEPYFVSTVEAHELYNHATWQLGSVPGENGEYFIQQVPTNEAARILENASNWTQEQGMITDQLLKSREFRGMAASLIREESAVQEVNVNSPYATLEGAFNRLAEKDSNGKGYLLSKVQIEQLEARANLHHDQTTNSYTAYNYEARALMEAENYSPWVDVKGGVDYYLDHPDYKEQAQAIYRIDQQATLTPSDYQAAQVMKAAAWGYGRAEDLRAEAEKFREEQADHEQTARTTNDPDEISREQAEAAEAETKAEDAWDKAEEREGRENLYEAEFDEETANSAKYADRARGSKPTKTVNTDKKNRRPKRRLRDLLGRKQGKSLEL